jgi:hypothetical protein
MHAIRASQHIPDHLPRQAGHALRARPRMEGPPISISGGQILLKAA